jgi:hypothetical protein
MNDGHSPFCVGCVGCALIFAFSAQDSEIVGGDSKNRCTPHTVGTLLRGLLQ